MADNTAPTPRISILLVTANRGPWLQVLLDGIQAQSDGRWELIGVDCGSDDDTQAILEGAAEKDARIRVHAIEEIDRAAGRRQALQRARGEFVMLADPNSHWEPTFLGSLLESVDAAPEKGTGVLFSGAQVVSEEGGIIETLPRETGQKTLTRALFVGGTLPLSTLLIRRKTLRSLEKTGNRFWLANDLGLLLWLAHHTRFQEVETAPPVTIQPIEGCLPSALEIASEERGEALTKALETFAGIVPARFARRCLSEFHRQRSRVLSAGGDPGEAFAAALRALMYRPLWPAAWKQLLRIAVRGQ